MKKSLEKYFNSKNLLTFMRGQPSLGVFFKHEHVLKNMHLWNEDGHDRLIQNPRGLLFVCFFETIALINAPENLL